MRRGLFWALGLVACGPGREDWPEGRPRIDAVSFVRALPDDATGLQFELQFSDSDGDLARGRLLMSLEDQQVAERGLAEIFAAQVPALATNAVEGAFEVVVRLTAEPAPQTRLKFGFVLEDAAGQRSNEPTLSLEARANGGG